MKQLSNVHILMTFEDYPHIVEITTETELFRTNY